MKWEWNGKGGEDDKSGTLVLKFSTDTMSITMPCFGDALMLTDYIDKSILEAEQRGAEMVIEKFAEVAEEIRQSY